MDVSGYRRGLFSLVVKFPIAQMTLEEELYFSSRNNKGGGDGNDIFNRWV